MSTPQPSSLRDSPPFNIPNALTAIRILAIPGVVMLLYGERTPWHDVVAAVLFGVAFWTDYFDGLIARKMKTVTRVGKIMDPIADKLLVLAAAIMLVQLGRINVVVAILLLGREVAVSGLRTLASSEGVMIPSSLSAKIKTFLEGFGLGFVILGPDVDWFHLPWMGVGKVLLYIGVVLGIWSAAIYFKQYYQASRPALAP